MRLDELVITLDIDWAPDFVVDAVAERLVRAGVAATWFATHASVSLTRLLAEPLFEVGIHPNFFPGSSQGDSVADVLRYCMTLVPDAVSMRTHGLFQSSRLLNQVMETTPIQYDSSVLLPELAGIQPVQYWWGGNSLLRFPIVWSDDLELQRRRPSFSSDRFFSTTGLRVLTFHPIHVFLNARDPAEYDRIKVAGALMDADRGTLERYVSPGPGIGTMFGDVLQRLRDSPTRRLREVAESWCRDSEDRNGP